MFAIRNFEATFDQVKANRECGRFEYGEAANSSLRGVLKSNLGERAPAAYGVYVVRAKCASRVLYVGKAGTLSNSGAFMDQGLARRLPNTSGGGSGGEACRASVAGYGRGVGEYVGAGRLC